MKKYSIPAEISGERGVGYIRFQPSQLGIVKKTLIVNNPEGQEVGIHIDFDAEGRIFGIEVMDDKMLPPSNEPENK